MICYHGSFKGGFSILMLSPFSVPFASSRIIAVWFRALKSISLSNSSKARSLILMPFPSPSRSQPSPSGQAVKTFSGYEPLPRPLRSFSSPNISAAFTCTCHTNFSTLSTSNIASISKESKGLFRVHESLCTQWHFTLSSLPWDFFIFCR